MEKLRKVVNEIAYTTPLSQNLSKLSPLQRSLIPLLFLSSSFYTLALSLRHFLYRHRLFRQHRWVPPPPARRLVAEKMLQKQNRVEGIKGKRKEPTIWN